MYTFRCVSSIAGRICLILQPKNSRVWWWIEEHKRMSIKWKTSCYNIGAGNCTGSQKDKAREISNPRTQSKRIKHRQQFSWSLLHLAILSNLRLLFSWLLKLPFVASCNKTDLAIDCCSDKKAKGSNTWHDYREYSIRDEEYCRIPL